MSNEYDSLTTITQQDDTGKLLSIEVTNQQGEWIASITLQLTIDDGLIDYFVDGLED